MGGDRGIDRRRLLAASALLGTAAASPGDAVPPTSKSETLSGTMAWQAGAAANPFGGRRPVFRFFDRHEAPSSRPPPRA